MPKRHQRTHTDFVAQCRSVVSSATRSYRSSHGPRGYRCNVFVHPCHRTDPLPLSLSLSPLFKKGKKNKNIGLPGTACGDAPQPWVLGSKAMFASWDRPWRVATIIIDGAANTHTNTHAHTHALAPREQAAAHAPQKSNRSMVQYCIRIDQLKHGLNWFHHEGWVRFPPAAGRRHCTFVLGFFPFPFARMCVCVCVCDRGVVRERTHRHINGVPRTNTAQTKAKCQSMNESKCTRKHTSISAPHRSRNAVSI